MESSVPKFNQVSSHTIASLQATLEQFVDATTGARHVHLSTEQDESAFLVAFPTVPQVSDGRAHILEHLVLCGSERFPVADPFFAMMRRSTATFMNAMTYGDRTVYPFATTHSVDFFNLLDVYLDATFHPKLDYLSFLQEGWRHTLADGKLAYQGVVLNEMKGVYSSPMRALSFGINRTLFEGTTYGIVSGGDPLCIPDLTHAQLLDFHARHYHPSNAIFMSAGRIPAADIQARIEAQVLSRATGAILRHVPELAPDWQAPRQTTIQVPQQGRGHDEFGLQLAWRFGESKDHLAAARLRLLAHGLMGNASAPLKKAMQSAGFGRPSSMNGADGSCRQLAFHVGMTGLRESQVDEAEALVRDALVRAGAGGDHRETLQAALRDMRFAQREIRGGMEPDAVSRLLAAVPAVMLDGDVVAAFDNEPVLAQLESEIQRPGFFEEQVTRLLDCPTQLTARVVPDAAFASRRAQQEQARLEAAQAALDERARDAIASAQVALTEHRASRGGVESLPRIAPSDVSRDPLRRPTLETTDNVTMVAMPTNGISYATVVFDLCDIAREDWPWVGLYCELAPELGVGKLGFEEASRWRNGLATAFSMQLDAVQHADTGVLTPQLSLFGCSLTERQADLATAMNAWMSSPRFDEVERIAFLVNARHRRKLANMSEAAGQYASLAATSCFSARRQFSNVLHGLPSLAFTASLARMLEGGDGAECIGRRLEHLHAQISRCRKSVTWVAPAAALAEARPLLVLAPAERPSQVQVTPAHRPESPSNNALRFAIQVNHCHIAWAAPGIGHPDAASLAVAAELLSSRILHRKLREEGGAYGGNANYSSEDGLFTMSTLRDPRVSGTYLDFDAALVELQASHYSAEMLDEAVIGVIKRLDKPLPPYADAMHAVRLEDRGVDDSTSRSFRHQVLDCTLDSVKTAARRWLAPDHASRAAAVGHETHDLGRLIAVNVAELAE